MVVGKGRLVHKNEGKEGKGKAKAKEGDKVWGKKPKRKELFFVTDTSGQTEILGVTCTHNIMMHDIQKDMACPSICHPKQVEPGHRATTNNRHYRNKDS